MAMGALGTHRVLALGSAAAAVAALVLLAPARAGDTATRRIRTLAAAVERRARWPMGTARPEALEMAAVPHRPPAVVAVRGARCRRGAAAGRRAPGRPMVSMAIQARSVWAP